ncbi:DUF5666 domain-containing protein [Pseudoalteromonas byunsanensis]|uniref:DUF5666 domain-containing protein n=1 Tax=Pseudoalteromonas byunsanensis TaxID=327939 RepID=A0A1S1N3C4_9GAMM|nr:DUF5666 domain-containing protein [Pseudoalteromonas byunsanensis]OHU95700.1 hypothetical protein BIW53_07650 [Pseudoalteromonas byunsanensis]
MRRLNTLFYGACLIALSGCGGGSGDQSTTPTTPTPSDPPAQTIDTGDLTVSIAGLPQGVSGNVTITGPDGYSSELSQSKTIADLTVGSYTVTANAVTAESLSYDVLPAEYTVDVSKNTTNNVELIYQSPVVSKGVVSNFGSIYVNGVRYDTSGTDFKDEDGEPSTEDDFEVGMLVTVVGRSDADGEHAQAEEVYFELKAKGPAEAISLTDSTLQVLGFVFLIDESTEFENTTLETLQIDDFVKISAIQNDQQQLVATHVELDNVDTTLKVAGVVSLLDEQSSTFSLDNLVIDYSTAEVEGVLADDEQVVVHSETTASEGVLLASHVKVIERESSDDDQDQSIQYALDGVISEVVDNSSFTLGDVTVSWSSDTEFFGGEASELEVGVRVKVHGTLTGDQLSARKIRLDKQGVIKLEGAIEEVNIDTRQVLVLNTLFTLDDHSKLKDKSSQKVRRMEITDLVFGDIVSIKAFASSDGDSLLVKQLTREAVSDEAPEGNVEIEGLVSSIEAPTLTVQDVNITTSAVTEFEVDGEALDADGFFAVVQAGHFVAAHAQATSDGQVLALEIEAKTNADGETSEYVKLSGAVHDFISAENFKVNGRLIRTNEFTHFEGGTQASLEDDVMVEIKGEEHSDGSIVAIKIEFESEDDVEEVEVKGAITAFTSITDFTVVDQPVTTDEHTIFKGANSESLAIDVEVEVEGVLNADGVLLAHKVDIESHQDEIEVSGEISNFVSAQEFSVNEQAITTTDETKFKHGNASRLADGVTVEIEGTLDQNNVLVASKIAFEKLEKVKLTGEVTSLSEQAFTIAEVTVEYSQQTQFEHGEASDLAIGITLKVEGRKQSDTLVTAEEIEFVDGEHDEHIEVSGKINKFTSATEFSIGARKITTDADTQYIGAEASDLTRGIKIHVKGILQDNNIVLAQQIEFDD